MFDKNSYKKLQKLIAKEQKGIFNRYLYEQQNWNSHLENSKAVFVDALKNLNADSIAVLGSGWLLDVPMDFLFAHFSKIYLVDIVHPVQLVKKYKRFNQVQFVQQDITQSWELLVKHKKTSFQEFKSLVNFDINNFQFIDADVVVSLNLISQLAELPFDYFLKFSNEIAGKLDYQVFFQMQHYEMLKSFKNWILISDVEEIRMGENEEKISLLHFALDKKFYRRNWIWKFDYSGLYIIGINGVKKIVKSYSSIDF